MHARIDSNLGIIVLDNHIDGNRLDPSMLEELLAQMRAFNADEEVRAILLSSTGGKGGAFSHGMNLDALIGESTELTRKKGIKLYSELLELMAFGDKAIISIVSGSVKAGGVGLVCASDIVIASDEAIFELSEVLFGIIPANVYPYFSQFRLSPSKAKFYTLTALPMDAHTALKLDLVDLVVSFDDLEKTLRMICKQLWRAQPEAMKRVKKIAQKSLNLNHDSFVAEVQVELENILLSESPYLAIKAMKEGGSPPWFSKFKPQNPLIEG